MQTSLGYRLAGLFSLVFALMLAAFAYYTAGTQTRLINQRLETHALTHARVLAAAAELALETGSNEALEAALVAVSGAPGLYSAEVVAGNGAILASRIRSADGSWQDPGPRTSLPKPSAERIGQPADLLFSGASIGPGGALGRVGLTFDRSAARNTDKQIRSNAMAGGAIMLLITICTVFLALRRPMNDVARAAAFARGLSTGKQPPLETSSAAPELATLADDLNQAAASLEQGRRALAYSERHYRELVETLAEPVFEADNEFLITYVNAPWEHVLGRSPEETLGKHLNAFITGDTNETFSTALGTLQHEGAAAGPVVLHGLRPRAREGSLDLRIAPRFDDANRLVGYSGAVSDVSVHKEAERKLKDSIHAAEAASRTKNAFLANISHEIRTPMNAIIGMTDLVLDSELSDEQREYLGLARNASETLLGIINNILDFSRIESGQVDFEQIPFSLRACVDLVIEGVAESAHTKRLKLSSQVDPMVPDALVGDPHRIRQVLHNLVGNGIKFTDQGFVSLRIELLSRDETEVVLRFAVRDSGVGIAPDKQACIFDAFSQVDDSATRRHGGTGLGLTISGELVARMHGRIEVNSEPGEGSTFSFTARLPIAQPASQANNSDWTLENMPALIVTGGERQNCPLCEMIRNWQMQPVQAESASRALELLESHATAGQAFPLVILGDSPGNDDVFELAESIQHNPLVRPRVMILVAGAGQRGDAARCRALGVSAYLTRPIEASDLFNAILQGFSPRRDGALITRHSLRERHNSLHVLVAEDNPVMREMTLKLLERLGHSAHSVTNGLEAVEASAAARFDLILMDIQMPEMSGLEATAAIRKREASEGHYTPIIALTAESREADREASLAAGMNGHVTKPVRAAEFATMLDAVARGSATGSAEAQAVRDEGKAEKTFDREAAIDYLGGDTALLSQLVKMYLEGEAEARTQLNRSIEDQDYRAAYAIVSTIKGSVGSLAANPAVAAASRVEQLCRDGGSPLLADALRTLQQELGRLAEALRNELTASPGPG